MVAVTEMRKGLARVALVLLAMAMDSPVALAFDPGGGKAAQSADANPAAKPRGTRQQRLQACERKVWDNFNRCADVCDAAFPADEQGSRDVCTQACEADAQRQYRKCDRIL